MGLAAAGSVLTVDAAGLIKGEGDFLFGLREVQGALNAASGDTYFLHQREDPWQSDVQLLQQEIGQLESRNF
jgi:hypothetical protein